MVNGKQLRTRRIIGLRFTVYQTLDALRFAANVVSCGGTTDNFLLKIVTYSDISDSTVKS